MGSVDVYARNQKTICRFLFVSAYFSLIIAIKAFIGGGLTPYRRLLTTFLLPIGDNCSTVGVFVAMDAKTIFDPDKSDAMQR
jgi:hypothetical protein